MKDETEIINTDLLDSILGMSGRMIAGSKSGYRKAYPSNVAVFNANIVVKDNDEYVKVWHGDLDLTKDHQRLLKLSEKSGKKLYILFEMDARFETALKPRIENYLASYDASQAQNLQVEISPKYDEYVMHSEDELNVIKYVKP